MPRPTTATADPRPELGAIAYEYMANGPMRGFIGLRLMPLFDTVEQSGEYPKIPIEAVLNTPDTKRAPRAPYARGGWNFEMGTFSCEEHGWEEPVDDVEARLYARFFDAEAESARIATDIIMRGHEKRVQALVQNTANAVGNAAVSVEWSTAATATPKADIKTAIQTMRGLSGLEPNAIVMSKKVLENCLNTAELRTYLQYTSPHLVEGVAAQAATLARYFGVEQVVVGGAQQNTAKQGQSAVIGDIWDDEYVNLMHISSGGPSLREPAFGRTMLWTTDSPSPVVSESYREEQTRSEIIRVRGHTDEAIIFVGANYILTNITA